MTPRPHPYTRRVVRLIDLARKEATRLDNQQVGPEHLLLALLREDGGAGVSVLRGLQVNLGHLHRMACSFMPRSAPQQGGTTELTPPARQAMDLAEDEARRLGHGFIGSEHVLLGLLREHHGMPAWVLQHAGVTLDATRAQVQQMQAAGQRFDNSLADRVTARSFRTQVAPRPGFPYQPSDAEHLSLNTFSGAARAVLATAHHAALHAGQTAINPNHLLLALLERREDVPAQALTSLGADLARLKAVCGAVPGSGSHVSPGPLTLTQHARTIVEQAADEALRRHAQVQPAHFLLALAREREGVAIAALRRLGLEPEQVYQRTSEALRAQERKR